jgi:hypothetical protein
MRIAYRADNLIDAHLVKHALEAVGIHCFVSGEYATGGMGELPAMGLVNVLIDDNDQVQAAEVIAKLASELEGDELEPDLGPDGEPEPA